MMNMPNPKVAYVVKYTGDMLMPILPDYAVVRLDELGYIKIVEGKNNRLRDPEIFGLAEKVADYFVEPLDNTPRFAISMHPEGIVPEFEPRTDRQFSNAASYLPLKPQEKTEFVECLHRLLRKEVGKIMTKK